MPQLSCFPLPQLLQIYPYWNVNKSLCRAKIIVLKLQIYPYWNVNDFSFKPCNCWIKTSNLSILECKYHIYHVYWNQLLLQIYPYWNVNLEECGVCGKILALQIYPYWNVNVQIPLKFNEVKYSSNLSILECKSWKKNNKSKRSPLQIYPYWNVNTICWSDEESFEWLQIYPYWNVN